MESKDKKQIVERLKMEEPLSVVREPDLLDPGEGKGWKRKSDGMIFYGTVFLGELNYLKGKKLKTPLKEVPEHFELIEL